MIGGRVEKYIDCGVRGGVAVGDSRVDLEVEAKHWAMVVWR
jgi:hypothetical protein